MEKSLVLIKPDAVERNLIGDIISIYEKAGLKVINIRRELVSQERAVEHYKEHEGRYYFEGLIEYIRRSPIVAIELEGENAIALIRELNGSTENPAKGTIREKFAVSFRENSVHASDSLESAERELAIWF